ncbi:MAG: acyl carrier protein [Candidatus Omnitrophota bacterium]|jgi:acyl carrier protein
MKQDLVKKEILEIIGNLAKIPPDKIDPGRNFALMGLDSFLMIEIIFVIERHYSIEIPQDSFGQIKNINDIITVVKRVKRKTK